MLTKAEKKEQYEQLRPELADLSTLFIMENQGLSVNEINDLRSRVRGAGASYKVVKNSVVRLAVEGTPLAGLSTRLGGPNALAYTGGDGVALGKVLREFVKDHPALSFRHAYLEGQILDPEQATKIADLPGREELLSKLAYLLQSPMRRLAVALNSPIQKLVSALDQIAGQKSES